MSDGWQAKGEEYPPKGYVCTECGGKPGHTSDWFRCADDRLCSVECAVVFLLRREGERGEER